MADVGVIYHIFNDYDISCAFVAQNKYMKQFINRFKYNAAVVVEWLRLGAQIA